MHFIDAIGSQLHAAARLETSPILDKLIETAHQSLQKSQKEFQSILNQLFPKLQLFFSSCYTYIKPRLYDPR